MVVSRVGEYQKEIDRVLDDVEQRLRYRSKTSECSCVVLRVVLLRGSDGRPYLFGKRMTAGDICFASMAALLVRPTELKTLIGTDAIVPSTYKKLVRHIHLSSTVFASLRVCQVDHYRSRRAGQFILRMYSEHRLSEGVKAAPFRQEAANKILGLRF